MHPDVIPLPRLAITQTSDPQRYQLSSPSCSLILATAVTFTLLPTRGKPAIQLLLRQPCDHHSTLRDRHGRPHCPRIVSRSPERRSQSCPSSTTCFNTMAPPNRREVVRENNGVLTLIRSRDHPNRPLSPSVFVLILNGGTQGSAERDRGTGIQSPVSTTTCLLFGPHLDVQDMYPLGPGDTLFTRWSLEDPPENDMFALRL